MASPVCANHVSKKSQSTQLIVVVVAESSLLENLPKTFMGLNGRFEKSARTHNPTIHTVQRELVRTWAFLCATGGDWRKRSATHDKYAPLNEIPGDVQGYLRDQHMGQFLQPMMELGLPTIYEQTAIASSQKHPIPYNHFPLFETRLRQLRHYMDNQKPRGLRQLWKDNRDSLNYYTF